MTNSAVASWWHADGAVVACDLCPNGCRLLHDGSNGICGLRFREGGELRTRGWNGAAAAHLDPVEKKPLHHFLPGSTTFSVGMTGCNLGCIHCQNWSLSMDRTGSLPLPLSPETIVRQALHLNASSVAFTYNEPLISAESWIEVAKECHRNGLRTIAVSNGYAAPECAREFFGNMDAANIDLKGFSESFYRRVCKGRLQPVLDTLELVRRLGSCHLEITTLLIPTWNDDEQELRAMGGWIRQRLGADTPTHVSAFHPDHHARDIPATSPTQVMRARSILLEEGLEFVYAGNIADQEGADTICPDCRGILVERQGFTVLGNRIRDGKCPDCGLRIPGVFPESG